MNTLIVFLIPAYYADLRLEEMGIDFKGNSVERACDYYTGHSVVVSPGKTNGLSL